MSPKVSGGTFSDCTGSGEVRAESSMMFTHRPYSWNAQSIHPKFILSIVTKFAVVAKGTSI